jgi:hypothetical protein
MQNAALFIQIRLGAGRVLYTERARIRFPDSAISQRRLIEQPAAYF